MSDLAIAVLQLSSSDGAEQNQQKVIRMLGALKDPSLLDVVFLPENSLYQRIDKSTQRLSFSFEDTIFAPFKEYCRAHQCHIIFGSNPMQSDLGITNSTVWIDPSGKITVPYTKVHLFDVDVKGEKPLRESDDFLPGVGPKVVEISGWKIGLSICYDVRFAELFLHYAKESVDLIAVPSAFLKPTGEAHWHVLLRARAIESQAYVVAAAQAGQHQSVDSQAVRQSYGHSLVVDPWGAVMADLGDCEGFSQLILSKEKISSVRRQIPMSSHRKL